MTMWQLIKLEGNSITPSARGRTGMLLQITMVRSMLLKVVVTTNRMASSREIISLLYNHGWGQGKSTLNRTCWTVPNPSLTAKAWNVWWCSSRTRQNVQATLIRIVRASSPMKLNHRRKKVTLFLHVTALQKWRRRNQMTITWKSLSTAALVHVAKKCRSEPKPLIGHHQWIRRSSSFQRISSTLVTSQTKREHCKWLKAWASRGSETRRGSLAKMNCLIVSCLRAMYTS